MQAVKFKDGTKDTIEGLLSPYGGPDFLDGKDFDGEYFSPETDFELEWFGDWERPVLFGHGTDEALKTSVIGRMKVTPTDAGLWMEAKLDESHAYKDAITELIEKEALGLSAGSIDRFYAHGVEGDGHIKHFPLIEGSLVTMPANPNASLAYAAKSTDAIEHLGILGVAVPDAVKDPPDEDDPTEDHEPVNVEPATKDHIWDAIKSVLSPQSLHDAAVASGAECSSEAHAEPPAPAFGLAPGNGAEKSTPAIDLDALAADAAKAAVEAVNQALS